MKNSSRKVILIYSITLILVAITIFSVNSCNTKEDCNINCVFGSCVNNICNCNPGYEGDSCTVLSTQRYIGNWDAYDTCETNLWHYTATIAASSSIVNRIIITNFGHFGSSFTVNADITGTSFTIPSQYIEGVTLSGSGFINVIDSDDAVISIDYYAEDEFHNTDHCSGVWTKIQ